MPRGQPQREVASRGVAHGHDPVEIEGGGTASGPVSFMRGADASAGTIKSGGITAATAPKEVASISFLASKSL